MQIFSVYDICFSPDGRQLVAAVGQRVLVVNVAEGTVAQTLRGTRKMRFYVTVIECK